MTVHIIKLAKSLKAITLGIVCLKIEFSKFNFNQNIYYKSQISFLFPQ